MRKVYDQAELRNELSAARNKLVVVYFSSGKCGPCRLTTPFLNNLEPQMPDVVFINVDTNESEDFIEHFEIKGIPAFFFFRKTTLVYKFEGANTQFLEARINELRHIS
ncbi:thioredoxin-like isoform X2 [Bombina bombina]|uniref:thioredoxin-like isoform X2 n=1 Tax=Bombina bombina TaxID=8345 RepID=UPI00235A5C25|nr:thioredoxin-like isoform X2 [Bombina bombina]